MPELTPGYVVVLDNALFHKSQKQRGLLQARDVVPTY